MQKVFISTGGFYSKSAYETALSFIDNGIKNIELSGGIHCPNQTILLKKLAKKASLVPHNYFPPPKESFVLNLASEEEDIYKKSREHIINASILSAELGSKFYSFHSGFLCDPSPNQLGKPIKALPLSNRKNALNKFIERINLLSDFCGDLGINLLIENNVLSYRNFQNFKSNPFLMVDFFEAEEIMKNTPDNVSLLIDVAHLKVSANTLQFDKVEYLKRLRKWTKAYHLSDNNSLSDTNKPLTQSCWFWPYLDKNIEYISIEVYNQDANFLKKQMNFVESVFAK